jgi:hypothetical protein
MVLFQLLLLIMALKLHTHSAREVPNLTPFELSVSELGTYADEIIRHVSRYRPEYAGLVRLQRKAGNRINEMFQPDRWSFPRSGNVQIKPQKGNATRIVSLSELGFASMEAMQPVLNDMARLPKGQYERAFSLAVKDLGLWRLYESGFTHPSTHFFRHLRIKELKSENYDLDFIANWIGEKNLDNLNYYLDSKFFGEVEA